MDRPQPTTKYPPPTRQRRKDRRAKRHDWDENSPGAAGRKLPDDPEEHEPF